jgi:ferric-dicitrate binding protein FerR (iron transport regulator)
MMQYEEKEIRRLIILYLEGKISLKDEPVLYEFISNDSNKDKFIQWENEWKLLHKSDSAIDKEWRSLRTRIQTREAIEGKIHVTRLPVWQKITAAAAVALLVLSATWTVYKMALPENKEIFVVEAPMGEKSKVILPDGSTIWLNAGSQIRYTNDFNIHDRNIELNGEAYFEVKKQTNTPFRVKLREYEIEVKGTKFNISSYENENTVTTLMEGAIILRYQEKEYAMKSGQMSLFDTRTKVFSMQQTNAGQYKSWTEDRIEYDEITLRELFNRLSRQYDIQIHVDPKINLNSTLRVSLNNKETPSEIFYGISKIISFNFKYENNEIYIFK